jgi:predicted membrane channel-forming protein YqfA (hemolysin III family)
MEYKPTWRKPAGMLLILLIIAIWAVIVASFSEVIGGWPGWLQAIVYIVAGIGWIFPVRPLLTWMELGRFR